ncbi:MAG: LLM class flavin-dependent oxidoreductase [Micromonosporaceae bacterium]|nr:LLM class flavin-dependent oxidoreductase [Micromonosporaceae bacterium]
MNAADQIEAAARSVEPDRRAAWGCTLPDHVDVGEAAALVSRLGFGAVWLHDRTWEGGPCGFVEAVVAGVAVPATTFGVWTQAGRDHPVRFAEDVAVSDRLLGGRLRVGVRGPCPPAWAYAVAHAWDEEGLAVDEPLRLPARDPANQWIPSGWRLTVSPRPYSAFVLHVSDGEALDGVATRRVTIRQSLGAELVRVERES